MFGTYIDEPLMMLSVSGGSEAKYYYHANALYCVAALTDANGAVVERYGYNPYGKMVISTAKGTDNLWLTADDTYVSSSSVGNPFTYTGRRYDPETGLYYYRARYFDADLGRFVGRDPLGYVDGMSLYQYVDDTPFNSVDPDGLYPTSHPHCEALRQDIYALEREIEKRQAEFARDDLNLPWDLPGQPNRLSRMGHLRIIGALKGAQTRLIARYQNECQDPPPPCPETEWVVTPATQKKVAKEAEKAVKVGIGVGGVIVIIIIIIGSPVGV